MGLQHNNWFDASMERETLLAYEAYYGNRYALAESEASLKRESGTVFIVIFNPKLALRFRQYYRRSTLFFVAPQPPEVLRDRLAKRGTTQGDVAVRQRYLEIELKVAGALDCFVNTSQPEGEQWGTIRKTNLENCPTIASNLRRYRAEVDA
jgi:guanylate kinase